MPGNQFGTLLKYTSWGESHGPAIGCVIDGMPPLIKLHESDIQPFLDRRKPGQSRYTTQRREPDKVRILSGVFEGITTGTPIMLLIKNKDQRPKDYDQIASIYRPGHADFVYDAKYGIRDPRGGGRSSARETASRVAAGALAYKILSHFVPELKICAGLIAMGHMTLPKEVRNWNEVYRNPLFCPATEVIKDWQQYLDNIRKSGSSIGAMIEVRACGVPVGLGEPVIDRLDADLAKAMMSINAVKSVEIGDGNDVVKMRGEQNADSIESFDNNGNPIYLSNHAGGIIGGISNGNEITIRLAIKPTSSISIPMNSVDQNGTPIQIKTRGRHDPCVGLRSVPVAEAMMALVLADHLLRHKAQCESTSL